ncbi:MAG: lysophospholipid acyltransferase family protein [Marinobacter sp.]|nr:lysophospholipid acyltransferase family protein [Marinobacter sp.]
MSVSAVRKSPPLYSPSRWGAWVAVAALYLLSLLPMRAKQRWGERIGNMLYRKLKSRAKVTRKNLQICLPELSEAQRDELARESFVACARGFLETTHAWWRDMTPYTESTIIHGLEHVREAQAQERGILLIGAHYSIFDFALPLIACQLDKPGYMYRPNNNPVIDRMIEKGRRRHYGIQPFTKRQLPEMLGFLREGGQVWYACDQDFGRKTQVFVPFFGVEAGCITTPSYIARESGAAIIFVSHLRTPEGRYQVTFSPIQKHFGVDEAQDAAAWNQFIEQTIRRYPDQYLWMHKRFKTRPEGAEPVY